MVMAPRKRMRPNPSESSSTIASTSLAPSARDTSTSQETDAPSAIQNGNASSASLPSGQKPIYKSRSWYGSWPRAPKSSASTPQLFQETILGGTSRPPSNPDLRRFETKKTSDTVSVDRQSDPATNLEGIPENHDSSTETLKQPETKEDIPTQNQPTKDNDNPSENTEQPTSPPRPATSSGWLGWFGRSPAPTTRPLPPAEDMAKTAKEPEEESNKPSRPTTGDDSQQDVSDAPNPQPPSTPQAKGQPTPAASSWLNIWGSTPFLSGRSPTANPDTPAPAPELATPSESRPEDTPMPDATPTPQSKSPPPSAGSTWAFWSRDVKPTSAKAQTQPDDESGQLAVIGQGSEAQPEPAHGIEVADSEASKASGGRAAEDKKGGRSAKDATKQPQRSAPESSSKKGKRLRPQSMDIDDSPVASSKSSVTESAQQDSTTGTKPAAATKQQAPATEAPAVKSLPPNLLLPSFGSTYQMKDNPSIIKQITQLLLRTRQPPVNHVFRVQEPPRMKKAIAIGVHGLFPATYLRPMVGQPTGTSLRFANLCADAIRRWADSHGCPDCEIEKVALEGEGKIADRVDNLWKLLLNWIEQIRSADLILLACHSQGVPVAILLLAKLIDLGIITNAKIGVCAMAGVSLGPFPDYKSSVGMLMGSAAELWEFTNPDSELSRRYETALKEVLEYGVRITYVGSIDDQLVPMESAVFSPASHPYIYRAVFIDGRIHAPDFIAHLVGFALKLRNLGVSDHGLVRELSVPLAGSLYSGEGHSRIYYDDQVYDLAVTHALETTDVAPHAPNRHCQIRHPHRPVTPGGSGGSTGTTTSTAAASSTAASGGAAASSTAQLANPNPYHLPWIMRGLLEEDFVKTELSTETEELLRQFDDWKPVTKALKDVKYRLEAVRSKL